MATKQITIQFTQNNVPVDTLTPSITIRDITDISNITVIINGDTMTSIGGDGGYAYNFTSYDKTKNYFISIDGGSTQLDTERYAWATNDNDISETTDSIWDELNSDHVIPGSMGEQLQNTVKTDDYDGYGA